MRSTICVVRADADTTSEIVAATDAEHASAAVVVSCALAALLGVYFIVQFVVLVPRVLLNFTWHELRSHHDLDYISFSKFPQSLLGPTENQFDHGVVANVRVHLNLDAENVDPPPYVVARIAPPR